MIPSTAIQSPILNLFSTNTKIPEIKFLNKSCAPSATATPNKPRPAIIGPILIPHNSSTAAAVLELWGIKIGPIIAGLGLFGVAVALGAQDLFKNLISGILVLVEKRFKIGDWIAVDGIIEGTVEKIGFRSTTIRKFDKSLAIIPNFQFAENAVVNVSETSNWRIRWIITLQYDTTIDQLKKIREEIESYINNSKDFNQSTGVAVRIEKFSDSSIDLLVRCFTDSNSWSNSLEVKERLAIQIKQIVENNNASFAFPSQSIYVEKK